ncbi:MAG: hypothetical protein P8Z00_08585 [Anaerolineales bacterium]|jgi:hypothetical protein
MKEKLSRILTSSLFVIGLGIVGLVTLISCSYCALLEKLSLCSVLRRF